MKKAIVSTSANPFHYGHLDIYNKAKEIFDDVKVIIAQNPEKSSSQNLKHHLNAYNIPYDIIYDKTVADYCAEKSITHIVRGIRNGVDAEYELKLDFANKEINPNIQTVFIPTTDVYSNISSSTIRELLKYKKYDIVKKYMNEEAMWRYLYGQSFSVFFGKSCIGKSTFLKNNKINAINVDSYMWEISNKIHGEEKTNNFKLQSHNIIYSNRRIEEKKKLIQTSNFFTEEYWDEFFHFTDKDWIYVSFVPQFPGYVFDWASVGFYYDIIPIKYKSQMKFIEFKCNENSRQDRIISKGFQNKIKYLDELYIQPAIIDNTITID